MIENDQERSGTIGNDQERSGMIGNDRERSGSIRAITGQPPFPQAPPRESRVPEGPSRQARWLRSGQSLCRQSHWTPAPTPLRGSYNRGQCQTREEARDPARGLTARAPPSPLIPHAPCPRGGGAGAEPHRVRDGPPTAEALPSHGAAYPDKAPPTASNPAHCREPRPRPGASPTYHKLRPLPGAPPTARRPPLIARIPSRFQEPRPLTRSSAHLGAGAMV